MAKPEKPKDPDAEAREAIAKQRHEAIGTLVEDLFAKKNDNFRRNLAAVDFYSEAEALQEIFEEAKKVRPDLPDAELRQRVEDLYRAGKKRRHEAKTEEAAVLKELRDLGTKRTDHN